MILLRGPDRQAAGRDVDLEGIRLLKMGRGNRWVS